MQVAVQGPGVLGNGHAVDGGVHPLRQGGSDQRAAVDQPRTAGTHTDVPASAAKHRQQRPTLSDFAPSADSNAGPCLHGGVHLQRAGRGAGVHQAGLVPGHPWCLQAEAAWLDLC